MRNLSGIFNAVFGEDGDKAAPPFTFVDGFTPQYSQPIAQGGLAPERTSINFLYNELYALGVDVNKFGGALPWDASITYEIGAVITRLTGVMPNIQSFLYIALTQTTNNDPVSSPADWQPIPSQATLPQFYTDNTLVANTYELASTFAGVVLPDYFEGMLVSFLPALVNTGASTVSINGLAAKSILDAYGASLSANAFEPNKRINLVFLGGDFVVLDDPGTPYAWGRFSGVSNGGFGQFMKGHRITASSSPSTGAVDLTVSPAIPTTDFRLTITPYNGVGGVIHGFEFAGGITTQSNLRVQFFGPNGNAGTNEFGGIVEVRTIPD